MTRTASTATETMLAIHEQYLVPNLLLPFADDMARRLARLSIGPLLELCAGTGVLTQAIAASMSAGLTIIATDPDRKKIERASSKPGMARVTWQKAEPQALPFADATFGIVACHFAVATMPRRIQAFQEVRRVMKPNGRFVFSVPASLRHNPVADCLRATLNDLFPADPPRYLDHGLHGYSDNETIDDDLTEVGFTDAIYTTIELPYIAASARDVAVGYCLGTPLRAEIEARAKGDSEPVIAAVVRALQMRFGFAAVASTMRAHVILASG